MGGAAPSFHTSVSLSKISIIVFPDHEIDAKPLPFCELDLTYGLDRVFQKRECTGMFVG